MPGKEIKCCIDLCAFIRANKNSPEPIEMALSDPLVLEKIWEGYLVNLIRALPEVNFSRFFPLVLTAEFLGKIIKSGFQLSDVIRALKAKGSSHLIVEVLRTPGILEKIQDGWNLRAVTYELKGSGLIPLVLRADVVAKIATGFQSTFVEHPLSSVICSLENASQIAIVLASDVIREKFPEVCDVSFANQFRYRRDLQALVVEAFNINEENARWSDPRAAWCMSVVRAKPRMGAGAPAGGGEGAAASESLSAESSGPAP
jgi:hypothetical protein